ncbi:MAG: hypothetical protein GEU80_03800 [Dehalococcoidia bacterium]|nr:hypothetical protein [Dehalococcoidia bacterium]
MAARLDSLRGFRLPPWLGPTALIVVSAAGIFAALWGGLFADPGITVRYFDAGAVNTFAIRQVNAFPEVDLYVVGLDNGKIRAIDMRVEASGCVASWLPEDWRGRAANPGRLPGVYEDPCSGAIWSMEGNAISGSELPLRTPHIEPRQGTDGKQHIFVELINQPKAG